MTEGTPMEQLRRQMAEAAGAVRCRAALGASVIRMGGSATFVGGDMIIGADRDCWNDVRAEQARCRRLIIEIDAELDQMTAPELRQALAWIRQHVTRSDAGGRP